MTDTVYISHPWSFYPGALAAGNDRTCAVDGLHEVYCWGSTPIGATGANATRTTVPTRVFTADVLNAMTISLGDRHACAIAALAPTEHFSFLVSAAVPHAMCWGDSRRGQLGDGTTTSSAVPGTGYGSTELWDVVAGSAHTCVRARWSLYCWGDDDAGQLGFGARPTPCPIAGGGLCQVTPFPIYDAPALASVTARAEYTCAVSRAEELYCWGTSLTGALGLGTGVRSVNAPTLVPLSVPIIQATAGATHACGLSSGGAALCWGSDAYHETGTIASGGSCGGTSCLPTPTAVQGTLRFAALSAGDGFTCGIAVTERIYCWGRNDQGQLGTEATIVDRCGLTPCSGLPRPIASDGRFVSVSAGAAHACAVTIRQELFCWGRNDQGQIGDGTTITRPTPVRVGK